MSGEKTNLYARWRTQNEARFLLRDQDIALPPERLLQSIWHHQRLHRHQLHTIDGQPIRVLHPGFWNHEAGPDFRGAVLQFGNTQPRTGDIEIDLQPANWRSHAHDRNPAFANVILHVIWNGTESAAPTMPSLAMEKFLDAPLQDMALWVGGKPNQSLPDELLGHCNAPLRNLSVEKARDLLAQAAQIRLQRKALEFQTRARQTGWEQSLWEGLFRALGYKQNIWPMQRLAELLPGLRAETPLAWQARLLGLAGLLPDNLADAPSDPHVYQRTLWDHWWRERESFSEVILPRNIWRFNGLRPANQPSRRLALAAHWLAQKDFFARLEKWFTNEKVEMDLLESLLACLQPPADDFWAWHWSFNSPRLPKPQPLLGASRATDLAINVILPWFWMRAHTGKNHYLQQMAEEKYAAWPAGQDNTVLRLARQRLLGPRAASLTNTAAMQQGLLQIVRDFCDHSNAVCADCKFPEMIKNWEMQG